MKRNLLYFIPLILILSLFGAACSNDDDDGEQPSSNNQSETQAGLSVGDEAPAFSLQSATGETVSLADYSGRPVLLYFHMAVG